MRLPLATKLRDMPPQQQERVASEALERSPADILHTGVDEPLGLDGVFDLIVREAEKREAILRASQSPTVSLPPPPADPGQPQWAHDLARAHDKVCEYWPDHWLLVESLLSACSTLLLKDVGQGLALFSIGPSGSGKSTCLYMFGVPERERLAHELAGLETLVEELDDFTPASFLSHYEGKTSAELEKQALASRLRNRVLLTSDLARLFRGEPRKLEALFGRLIRVLDGEGLRTDSGVHGTHGVKGDYSFVWLAGTTPFRIETWRTMAQLGTRLLFFRARDGADTCPDHVYKQARDECRAQIFPLLDLWRRDGRKFDVRRRLPWPSVNAEMTKEIRSLADLVAAGQTVRSNVEEEVITRPASAHFRIRLTLLACGRAVMYGRTAVDPIDLPMLRHIAQSSMYGFRGPTLVALHQGIGTVKDIIAYAAVAFGRVVDESTVRKTLTSLKALDLVYDTDTSGAGTTWRLR